jgi:hypothetical protein
MKISVFFPKKSMSADLQVGGFRTVTTTGEAFPVGSVFITAVETNPAELLGYGEWEAFGSGRVLVGYNDADPDFDTPLKEGGSKQVASAGSVGSIGGSIGLASKEGRDAGVVAQTTHTHPAPSFTGQATSVVQPYVVVFFWKRVG